MSKNNTFRIKDEDDYAREEYLKKQVGIITNNSKKNNSKKIQKFGSKQLGNEKDPLSIKSNNSSYKDSNLLSFLIFLCKKNLMNDVRIVCHSGIMKTFVTNLELSNKNKSLNSSFKQNLWTLFLKNNNNFNISISRHAYTFANLLKEKGRSIEQTREKDTQLSLYGILTSLNHGNNLVANEKISGLTDTPNLVYVSVLIRTWMTAICLYLPHNNSNTFTLVVSPFLKEEGSTPDNTPEEFSNQIKNITIFLKYLMELQVKNSNIKENIEKIKNFFLNSGKLIICKLKDKYEITFMHLVKNNKSVNSLINLPVIFQNNPLLDNPILNLYIYKNNNNSSNYFNIKNNSECNTINFSEINVFDGIEKLNPKNIITSRWCEPFAKQEKFIGFGQNTCASKMKKIA